MSDEKRASHLVWRGAAILTGAALLVKIMSALYRLPYQNFAGDVGFYVYQQVYPFYALAVALGGTGFPIVISKYMAEAGERHSVKVEVQRHALIALMLICGLFFTVLFFFAQPLSAMIGDQHLPQLIRIAASVYLFVPIVALLRGTFQGDKENMLPTALSQIGEQVTRVCFILGLSWYLFLNHGDAYTFGLAATSGSAFAPLVTMIILILFLPRKKQFARELFSRPAAAINWRLVKNLIIAGCLFSILAVPLLLFQLIDSLTVLRLLGKVNLADPRAEKGIYDRAYMLTQFGIIASASLTAAMVPRLAQLTALRKTRDFQMEATLSIKVSLAFGAAAAAGLMTISREVNIMLFRNADGTAAFAIASFTMLTLSIILTASGILEANEKPWVPFYFLAIGACVKGAANYFLVPHFAIVGAALGTCMGTAVAAELCLVYLHRHTLAMRLSWRAVAKLGIAVSVMAASVFLWKKMIHRFTDMLSARPSATVLALSGAVVGGWVFIMILYMIRFLNKHDLKRLPIRRRKRQGEAAARSRKL
ncbi:polysaccharide biosynthesis protein [Sporolactobacillus shoreicorticis]|uniref:Oligosaccharide flippase family protein n=1 Tax=Sporolactobacillus shoreicorticis TaxID=1923877 RepID=A0ABW5S947_9BACL|nr:polysaccharide biosynthesis protein [Sporolactobacillus shoreicorticis]MCO7127734.1 polysaccharide biosynthesis protein [Sporolactobacillus shoreicorticis]